MAWDASRPIPWRQLVRDWLILAVLMTVVLLVVSRNRLDLSVFLGMVASGPIYLVIGVVLAKFGYRRKTMAELRVETDRRQAEKAARAGTAPAARGGTGTGRARPAPTKRTGGGTPKRPGGRR